MRLVKLVLWDIKLQIKYGFYALYGILTVIYIVFLQALPISWREYASAIVIFTDPAAMGLFFMGAIVLLEKSQRLPCVIAVSPIRTRDYVTSKVVSLCFISILVAMILSISVGGEHITSIVVGTGISSIIFSLFGMIIATKITSLNQFILFTLPIEIVGFVPAIIHLFDGLPGEFTYYPVNLCIDYILGREVPLFGIVILVLMIVVLYKITCNLVSRMFVHSGGEYESSDK